MERRVGEVSKTGATGGGEGGRSVDEELKGRRNK